MTTPLTLLKRLSNPWKPHKFQKKAVKFLIEHGAAALFLDPGLGKTSITLGAIKILKQKKLINYVLIIAPLRVCVSVWPKEVLKWKDFHGLTVKVLHGPDREDRLMEEADIYVINPEGLEWLFDITKTKTKSGKIKIDVNVTYVKSLGFDVLVIDELSKFKHTNSGRFKAMKQVIHLFRYRWGLTGSPASNGLEGLFGQCYMLDEGNALGRYISHYRHNYFIPSYSGFGWDIRPGAEEEIYEKIKPLALRIGDDVLDMPTLIENKIEVELSDKVMEEYRKLEKDLIVRLEEGDVTAATAATASMKCRQMACGSIYLDDEVEALKKLPSKKRKWTLVHDMKLDALEDLIDELQGSPLLIAYEFQHELARIKKRFGDGVPHIGGGVSTEKALELETQWNNGELPYLFGHPQSIGHGLNLQERGHHVAWASLTWDYELYDQFIRRVQRQGNKHKRVYVHQIVATDTVDELLLVALKSKKKGQNALFDALNTLIKK